ncbi:hypothetical protein ACE6H2_004696 [Prunus campanulata]
MVMIVDLFNDSKSYGLLHFIDRGREGKSSAAWDKTILMELVHRNASYILDEDIPCAHKLYLVYEKVWASS